MKILKIPTTCCNTEKMATPRWRKVTIKRNGKKT